MRSIQFCALMAILAAGCAQVEQTPDVLQDPGTDPGLDTATDPASDLVADTPVDTEPDVPADTAVDTAVDTAMDTGVDTTLDTGVDTWVDTVTDTGVDTVTDTGVDTATDPGAGWGTAVCGAGGTVSELGTWTQSVTIGDLGTMRAIQLDIDVADRSCLGSVKMPFDDLTVSLTSPAGTEHVFWYEFEGEDVGGFFPDYEFTASWILPRWWMTSVGGTWTLEITDSAMQCLSPKPTGVASWCLTPIDPATHAATDTGASLNACAPDTGSISDCDAETCPRTTIYEMQVTDLILASGTPTLELSASHSDPSQLTIELTTASGYVHSLWSGGGGSLPTTFDLTGMTGAWMTGRYQLLVRDDTIGDSGSVSSWCVRAN